MDAKYCRVSEKIKGMNNKTEQKMFIFLFRKSKAYLHWKAIFVHFIYENEFSTYTQSVTSKHCQSITMNQTQTLFNLLLKIHLNRFIHESACVYVSCVTQIRNTNNRFEWAILSASVLQWLYFCSIYDFNGNLNQFLFNFK